MPTISSKALTAGEVVFEGKPLVHIVKNEYKEKHCDNCLQRTDSLKRCAKCLQMFYCDRNCQTFDWIQHKNECKLMASNADLIKRLDEYQRLLLRLVLCIQSDQTFATKRHQLSDGSDVCLNDIKAKRLDQMKKYLFSCYFVRRLDVFRSIPKLRNCFEDFFFWLHLLCVQPMVIPIEMFNEKTLYSEIGFGFCVQTSVLSHSCHPNTAIVNNGLTLQVRAMASIGSGEELTISYIDLAQDRDRREERLKCFGIVCKCLHSKVDYNLLNKFMENLRQNSFRNCKQLDDSYIRYMTSEFFIYGKYYPKKTINLLLVLNAFSEYNDITGDVIRHVISMFDDSVRVTHGVTHVLRHLFATVHELKFNSTINLT